MSNGYHGAYIDTVENGHLKELVQEFRQRGGHNFDCEEYFGSDASDIARVAHFRRAARLRREAEERAEEVASQPLSGGRQAEEVASQPLSGSPQPMPDPQPSSASFRMPPQARVDIRVNLAVRYQPW